MIYPERLLPSSHKLDFFDWCNSCYLCRSTLRNDNLTNPDGSLNPAIIELNRTIGLSTNYIRCNPRHPLTSELEDVYFIVKNNKYTTTPFNSKNQEKVPKAKEVDFEIDKNKGWFLLKCEDFNDIKSQIPFNRTNKDEEIVEITLKVEHEPTLVNLFHFQINAYKENKKITSGVKGYKKKISHIIRDRILEYYHLEVA